MKLLLTAKGIIQNDYVFSVISKIITVVVSVFHTAFLARFLGPELKGVAASINSVVTIGSMVITAGIHQSYLYYRKRDASKEFLDRFCSNVLIVYSVISAIAGVVATILKADIVVIASIVLIPLFGYEMIINYVFLVESSKRRNVTNILAGIIETTALFVFWLCFKPNNWLMVIGISISMALRGISSTVGLHFHFSPSMFSIRFLGKLLKFGFLPMLALLLSILNTRLDILMLKGHSVITDAQIGIYSVGIALAEKALCIPEAIREILLGKLVAGKEADEVARACRIGTAISVFTVGCILAFGNIVISILYGAEYSSAYSVTWIGAIGTIFMVYIKMVSQYNIVNKKQTVNAILLSISVSVNVIFNLILIPKIDITGAAVATLIGHFVSGMCFVFYFVYSSKTSFAKTVLIQKEDLKMLKSFIRK